MMKRIEPGATQPESPQNSPPRIMVVDDDPFVRSVTVAALGNASGAAIRACASGAEALAVAADFRPTLVLMDLVMPGMDGYAAWNALREALKPPPLVVFLTARDDAATRGDIVSLGAAGFIAKPFDPSTLAAEVRRMTGMGPVTPLSGADRLAGLALEFRRSLEPAAEYIETTWRDVRADGWKQDAAAQLLDRVHKLAGSAGLFHLHRVGAAANEMERLLLATSKLDQPPSGAQLSALDAAAWALVDACKKGDKK